jgi:antitoxin MazE
MTVQLRQENGAFVLTISPELAAQAGLTEGAELVVSATSGRLVAESAAVKRPTLEELLAKVTPENLHGEWDVGPPVGREVW